MFKLKLPPCLFGHRWSTWKNLGRFWQRRCMRCGKTTRKPMEKL